MCYSASCPSRCSARFGFLVPIITAYSGYLHRLLIIHRPFVPPFVIFPSFSFTFRPTYTILLFFFIVYFSSSSFFSIYIFISFFCSFFIFFVSCCYSLFIFYFSQSSSPPIPSSLSSFPLKIFYISLFLLPPYSLPSNFPYPILLQLKLFFLSIFFPFLNYYQHDNSCSSVALLFFSSQFLTTLLLSYYFFLFSPSFF